MKKLPVFICLLLAIPAYAGTIYVDVNAAGANNGSSWADAYKYLQDALTAAGSGSEIWVAQGSYRPDMNTARPTGTNDRSATFQLKNGVALYGGFPHGGGSRDPNIYTTTLSGDINVPDNNSDNSYHVVYDSGTNSTAILDGFTIIRGYANGSYPYDCGAGIYNIGNPTVTNCTFSNNSASSGGGGMANESGRPKVNNCTFSGNSADFGGGIYNEYCNVYILTNCTFSGNEADYYGGGIYNFYSHPILTNCTFGGNMSSNEGGGMFNRGSSWPTLTNCTFRNNSATSKGGGIFSSPSSPTIANCILWGNTALNDPQIYGSATVSFSDVQGGWTGTGNINADPCFVTGPGGNYYLSQIASGQAFNSPCVDAGSDTAANLGMDVFTTRTDSIGDMGIVDMGYHYPPLSNPDLNGDTFVDLIDYAILANQWMLKKLSFDIAPGSGDGIVNFLDYAGFADGWLQVNDMNDLADFASQWLQQGAFNADIAPAPHGDGLVDASDLAVLCDNWLKTF